MKLHLPRSRRLTLFRGEDPSKLRAIYEGGVVPRAPRLGDGLPDLAQLQFGDLPADLTAAFLDEAIRTHVRIGSARSPFVSFSRSANVAIKFSLDHRRIGLLLRAVVMIVADEPYQTPTGVATSHRDREGRLWVPTAQHRSPDVGEILRPGAMAHLRRLGAGDDEYLVFGTLSPHELEFAMVEVVPATFFRRARIVVGPWNPLRPIARRAELVPLGWTTGV